MATAQGFSVLGSSQIRRLLDQGQRGFQPRGEKVGTPAVAAGLSAPDPPDEVPGVGSSSNIESPEVGSMAITAATSESSPPR